MKKVAFVAVVLMTTAAGGAFAQTGSQAQRIAALMQEMALPSKVAAALNRGDAKYKSAECVEARKIAEAYVDTTGQRVALAVGASVILALAGARVAIVPDPTSEGIRRDRFNRAMVARCASNSAQIGAALAVLSKRQEADVQTRRETAW